MLLSLLIACAAHYYEPLRGVKYVTSGGGDGEIYLVYDLYCPMHFGQGRVVVGEGVARCKVNNERQGKSESMLCSGLINNETLGEMVMSNEVRRVEYKASRAKCASFGLDIDLGESGWTPTESGTNSEFIE